MMIMFYDDKDTDNERKEWDEWHWQWLGWQHSHQKFGATPNIHLRCFEIRFFIRKLLILNTYPIAQRTIKSLRSVCFGNDEEDEDENSDDEVGVGKCELQTLLATIKFFRGWFGNQRFCFQADHDEVVGESKWDWQMVFWQTTVKHDLDDELSGKWQSQWWWWWEWGWLANEPMNQLFSFATLGPRPVATTGDEWRCQ